MALGTTITFFVRLLREMKLNQLQSEFLARISHDLKTPLATLELSSSLLKNGDLSPADSERLWKAHASELNRLKDQVNLLLESARVQSTRTKPHAQWMNLDSWISDRTERWKTMMGTKTVFQLEGQAFECEAFVDVTLLDLIVDNLIDNAVKFSHANGIIRMITTIEPRQDDSIWKIEVVDQGLGYDPKEAKKIFQRFYRSRHSAEYSIPGTGLGLHLVAEAAKKLGLTLGSASLGHGKGAAFSIEGRGRYIGGQNAR